jgi:CotH protein.
MKTRTLLFIIFTFITIFSAKSQITFSFSKERGYYDEPFTVTISASISNAQIFYTLDGSRPNKNSTPYTQPVAINTTTPLSVIAYHGMLVSSIVTHTYLFIDDIVKQPNNPAGYPSTWGPLDVAMGGYSVGTPAPADYAMDAAIINNPAYSPHIEQAFKDIPFVSIVTDKGYIFSHSLDVDTGGIYIYTGWRGTLENGRGWERPCSVEFYEPATGKQFQENCGVRLHGGNSRRPSNAGKHAFRISFRSMYGIGKLRFPIFDSPTATDRYDHLVLRAGYNYSWVKNDDNQQKYAQYVYDSFAKRTQLEMGHLSCHDMFVHLFVNGLYWGLYDISEKLTNNFMNSYLGGTEEDYDMINGDGVEDGNATAFDRLKNLAKDGNYNQLKTEDLMFFENFIDYILINFYIGNNDWSKNWFVGINRVVKGDGFRFFCWDSENAFTGVDVNKINSFGNGTFREILFGSSSDSGNTNGGLMKNATFKNLFAQRAGLHLLGNGVLTPEKAAERYEKLCDEIDKPIILESARWGDFRRTTLPHNNTRVTYTRNDHWLPQKEALLKNYFPQRTAKLIQQLANIGITPIPSDVHNVLGEISVFFADNHLFYKIPQNGKVVLNIFSLEGKQVFTNSPQNQFAGLHNETLYFLNAGTYIYKMTYNKQVFTGKFVKK